ncbi:MAG: YlxR family protein [Armatimonadetes bacterium]|nr:YlxR family protein [Armatimonadota bacterium]
MSRAPIRTCVACKRKAEKAGLLRVSRDAEGRVSVGMGGRGAYVCANDACVRAAVRKKLAARPLRIASSSVDWKRLEADLLAELHSDTNGQG